MHVMKNAGPHKDILTLTSRKTLRQNINIKSKRRSGLSRQMRSVSDIDKQNRNAFSFFKHLRWLKEVWNLVGKCKFSGMCV